MLEDARGQVRQWVYLTQDHPPDLLVGDKVRILEFIPKVGHFTCEGVIIQYTVRGTSHKAIRYMTLDYLKSSDPDDDRCEHGMFFSGAGACPQCGGGAEYSPHGEF